MEHVHEPSDDSYCTTDEGNSRKDNGEEPYSPISDDKLDELGILLKQYERTLDLIFREQFPENKKTEYELNNEEIKEQIRFIIADLNKFFEENPKDKKFYRFKKLNEKYQFLLFEESKVLLGKKEESKESNFVDDNQKGIRYFPS